MPFSVPTLTDLAKRAATAFRSNLKGSDAALWPNNVAVSAKVMAGAVWEAFSFLDYISRQAFAATAEGQWIERHAAEYGMARLAATYALGSITLAGDNGVTVPAGLILVRADGVEYETTTSGVTASGTVTVKATARTAGKTGNAASGVALALSAPLDRISSDATVAAAGIGSGADTESDESLRQRVLFRKRMPPHGGAAHDYVAWAREINGVTRVFVDPVTAVNERTSVGVYILMDDLYVDGIPQAADVAAVAAHIDALRPAGAIVAVEAPGALTIDVRIDDLAPDTAAVRDAVALELADLFRRAMRVSTLTDPYTLRVSKLWEAVSRAAGEDSHRIELPGGDVVVPPGYVPVLGTLVFE